jgi:hypothetical protein
MITLDTEEILMVLYAFGAPAILTRAIEFAVDCLKSYCNAGECETAFVTTGASD